MFRYQGEKDFVYVMDLANALSKLFMEKAMIILSSGKDVAILELYDEVKSMRLNEYPQPEIKFK